jgi:predicted nucleotidyltransferase
MTGATPPAAALAELDAHPHPLLFVTVSGAHLYGFASPDSDWDLRGVHVLPLEQVVRLEIGRETVEVSTVREGVEVDLVTHDVRKFFGLLLTRNGYVLEQLCSPLVVRTSPAHAAALALVPGLVTRHHGHHYLGFSRTQWRLVTKESPPRVKPLLYVYRALLTGLHLVRTGEVVADLPRLAAAAGLGSVPELIARKREGPERATLAGADLALHEAEVRRLEAALEEAMATSPLPDAPRPEARRALDDLLVKVRLAHREGQGGGGGG